MSLTYGDFYMPVFAIGDILCFARHGSLGLGNFYDRAPLSFFDRRPSRFIFCCTRRRIKAKKLRGTVWRRAFRWSRHTRLDGFFRRSNVRMIRGN